MKKVCLFFLLLLPYVLISQKQLTIIIGNGFEGSESSLYVTYTEKDESPVTKACFEDVQLKDNFVTDLSYYLEVELPQKGIKEVLFESGGNQYRFCFNRIKNKSKLKIEMLDGVRFCFIQ